jgi:hypothetical protein
MPPIWNVSHYRIQAWLAHLVCFLYSRKSGGAENVSEGTFTVAPYTAGANIGGSYSLRLANAEPLEGSFSADICPFDPSGCD